MEATLTPAAVHRTIVETTPFRTTARRTTLHTVPESGLENLHTPAEQLVALRKRHRHVGIIHTPDGRWMAVRGKGPWYQADITAATAIGLHRQLALAA